eukprot:4057061-Pleurochrysis_carterae.AAC.3
MRRARLASGSSLAVESEPNFPAIICACYFGLIQAHSQVPTLIFRPSNTFQAVVTLLFGCDEMKEVSSRFQTTSEHRTAEMQMN